jgi:hypothetical protein
MFGECTFVRRMPDLLDDLVAGKCGHTQPIEDSSAQRDIEDEGGNARFLV